MNTIVKNIIKDKLKDKWISIESDCVEYLDMPKDENRIIFYSFKELGLGNYSNGSYPTLKITKTH